MNIPAITPYLPTFNFAKNRHLNSSVTTIQTNSLNYLSQDTVSFGVGEKKGKPMSRAVTKDLAQQVEDEVSAAAKRVHNTLKKYMKPLVANASKPNNPICAGEKGIKYRIKGEFSLRQKTASRDIINRQEILTMGDILGHRIILRDASQKNVDKVLKQLAEAVKQGDMNIIEIESYVTASGRGYATPAMLDKLAAVCNPNKLRTAYDQKIPSGYPAIHIGFLTREGYVGELQIMGQDVEELKDYDDIVYKILDDKPLAHKYKTLEIILKATLDTLDEDQFDAYMQYRRDSFQRAFDQQTRAYNSRLKTPLIKIPYFLPENLDYQAIAAEKSRCEKMAELKEKQEINKSPKTQKITKPNKTGKK